MPVAPYWSLRPLIAWTTHNEDNSLHDGTLCVSFRAVRIVSISLMLPVAVYVLKSALDVARQSAHSSSASEEFSTKTRMWRIRP